MKTREPNWLDVAHIHPLHEMLLARFGGAPGTRDEGTLASVMDRPKNLFNYEEPSVFDLAACYAVGLVKNHPFIDGAKRTGFMAAYVFLGLNGYQLAAPEEEAVLHTLALAAGEETQSEYAAWLKATCEKRS